jgi:hypothetical protein
MPCSKTDPVISNPVRKAGTKVIFSAFMTNSSLLMCHPRPAAGAPGHIAAGIAQNASRLGQRRTGHALNTAPAIA